MRIPILGCLLFLLSIELIGANRPAPAEPFSLIIATQDLTVKSGDDVRVTVTLTNTSRDEITFYVSNPECDYSVGARDADGAEAHETQQKREQTCSIKGRNILIRLQPQESHEDEIVVSHLKDMTRQRKYLVKVMRRIPALSPRTVESNTIEITVANPPSS